MTTDELKIANKYSKEIFLNEGKIAELKGFYIAPTVENSIYTIKFIKELRVLIQKDIKRIQRRNKYLRYKLKNNIFI